MISCGADKRWAGVIFAPNRATDSTAGCYITSFNGAYEYEYNGSFKDVATDADKLDIMYEFVVYSVDVIFSLSIITYNLISLNVFDA